MTIKLFKRLLLTALALIATSSVVSAEDPPISVLPIYPENQVEGNRAYFDLGIEETNTDHKQVLTLQIRNNTDTVQTVTLKPVDSTFSPNGSFEYNVDEPLEGQRITKEPYDMHQYLTVEEPVHTLKPKEVIRVPFTFHKDNSKEDFEGQLMGGMSVYVDNPNNKDKVSQFGVITEMRFVVALVATFKEKEETRFEFNGDAVIQPQPMYYDIMFPIHHATGSVLANTRIWYEVLRGQTQLFESAETRKFNFSPYSETYVAFPWLKGDLEEGVPYTLKGTITYTEDNGKEKIVPFQSKFTYTGQEDYIYEGDSIEPPNIKGGTNIPWWLLPAILIPLLLALLLFLLAKRRKKFIFVTDETNPAVPLLTVRDQEHMPIINRLKKYEKGNKYLAYAPEGHDLYVGHLYKLVMEKDEETKKKYKTYEYLETVVFERRKQ